LADERVDELIQKNANYLLANLEQVSRSIEDRLRHKYVIPFPAGHATIEGWVIAIVQTRALLRAGIDPSDQSYSEVVKLAEQADTQITEASDPQSAKWNLPLITATDGSAISKGAPFGYSESSPYTWTDVQMETVDVR
jgi:hypothetical protein